MVVQRGACSHDPSRPTAVVASHEASTTGAPILALNIAQHLSATHNVVVLLLKGGALGEQFQACSTALIQARFGLANRKLSTSPQESVTSGQAGVCCCEFRGFSASAGTIAWRRDSLRLANS